MSVNRRTLILGGAAALAAEPTCSPSLAGANGQTRTRPPAQPHPTGPALLHAAGRYFATAGGKKVYLAGFHNWSNRQDIGAIPFDFTAYLNVLTAHNANLVRLWVYEAGTDGGIVFGTVGSLPYTKVGRQYDLTSFNQRFFDTLRARVQAAAALNMYVSIMLFQGWSVNSNRSTNNPWLSHPYKLSNNINRINGDPSNTNTGSAVHTLAISEITALQQAYVNKTVDTVYDLDNVLFEICNEAKGDIPTIAWQKAMVDYVHTYESGKGSRRHPVGMTACFLDTTPVDTALLSSNAEWIAPVGTGAIYASNPPASTGTKVSIVDTDHVFGIGGDAGWVWKQFTRGHNVLYMDDLSSTTIAGRLSIGLGAGFVANESSARIGIKGTRQASTIVDMNPLLPSTTIASTTYALSDAASDQFVVYAPRGGTFTVNLSGSAGVKLRVKWVNVSTGAFTSAASVLGGAKSKSFTSPFAPGALILTP